jgi:hypothetical protein
MAPPSANDDNWVLSPVLIAAQPISQIQCELNIFTEHERHAKTKEQLCCAKLKRLRVINWKASMGK